MTLNMLMSLLVFEVAWPLVAFLWLVLWLGPKLVRVGVRAELELIRREQADAQKAAIEAQIQAMENHSDR